MNVRVNIIECWSTCAPPLFSYDMEKQSGDRLAFGGNAAGYRLAFGGNAADYLRCLNSEWGHNSLSWLSDISIIPISLRWNTVNNNQFVLPPPWFLLYFLVLRFFGNVPTQLLLPPPLLRWSQPSHHRHLPPLLWWSQPSHQRHLPPLLWWSQPSHHLPLPLLPPLLRWSQPSHHHLLSMDVIHPTPKERPTPFPIGSRHRPPPPLMYRMSLVLPDRATVH